MDAGGMESGRIFGLSAALVTPFGEDGNVDTARLVLHATKVLTEGCDSFTLFGTTGEGYGLSMKERETVLAAVKGSGIDMRDKVYAGVSAVSVDDAVSQAKLALDAGVRGLLFAPPFYLKGVEDEGLYAWFSRAIERIGPSARGIILYHIPGQTSVPISVGLVSRLKKAFPGTIIGVKDSSGRWEDAQAFLAAHGELAILIGDERMLARGVRAGAQGSICGLANMAPGLLRPVIHEGKDNDKVVKLVDMICRRPVLPTVKALTSHVRKDAGYARMRPPVTDLDPALARQAAAEFDAILAA
jgi:4-hydroxy-tetrahydrodipicolinate synthase